MEYFYYIVDRNRTNVVLFLTPSHWVDENARHKALRFKDKRQAQLILDTYLKRKKLANKCNLYRVEPFFVAGESMDKKPLADMSLEELEEELAKQKVHLEWNEGIFENCKYLIKNLERMIEDKKNE